MHVKLNCRLSRSVACQPRAPAVWLLALVAVLPATTRMPALLAQQPVVVRPASMSQETLAGPAPRAESIFAVPPQRPRENVPTLALADLEQLATTNNPSLARAAALVSSARGKWIQVGLPPNPSWGYLGQQLGSGRQASQHALLLDGELITGGKLALNRAVVEQEIVRAEQDWFAQQQRVLTDVRIAYYEALLAQRNLELAHQLLRIGQGVQSMSQRLQRAGEATRIDLRQAEIELYTAENNLNDAQARHAAAWRSLQAVLGTPWLGPADLVGDLESLPPDLSWDEALARLLETSPELSAAGADVDRARMALSRERREVIPNFRYQLAVMQDLGIGGKTDGIVQALVPLPLLNRNQGGISQATAELAAAEQAMQQVQLDLQQRLAGVYQRYSSAAFRARRFQESILPAARESLELVEKSYGAGELAFLNLLNAQRTYFQKHQEHLQALLELRTAAAQMEGSLLSGGLAARP